MPTQRYRVMVNLPDGLDAAVLARAKIEGRSVANYLENLAAKEIARLAEESPGSYISSDSAPDASSGAKAALRAAKSGSSKKRSKAS
jgi:hypothetical protein